MFIFLVNETDAYSLKSTVSFISKDNQYQLFIGDNGSGATNAVILSKNMEILEED